MKLIFITFILLSLSAKLLFAQQNSEINRFAKADTHAAEVSKQFIFHPELLAEKLSEGMSNDYDKVRAFYTWIALNIEYDFYGFTHHRPGGQSVNEVLKSGKALCTGYSLLFKFFCESTGIPAVIIEGYAKGYGYQKGQKFTQGNHAWNAVYIHGSWYLLDVTWATGDPLRHQHQRKINLVKHFLVDPEEFVLTHLPEDPSWQLLNKKVLPEEFETGKKSNDNPANLIDDYSPADYDELDEFDAELLMYKRSLQFNPENVILYERLSFAYVYKAIFITDNLYRADYESDTLDMLESVFYAYLDSASAVAMNMEDREISGFKEKLTDEINYQKGVFNYEIGTEIFIKSEKAKTLSLQIHQKTSSYFELAKKYFSSIPETSIYFPSAGEYIENINLYHQRESGQFSPNRPFRQ